MPKQSQEVPQEYIKYKEVLAKEIGARIRQRRLALKLSQGGLREKMQLESVFVTRSQFSRIESGIRLPLASEVIALAAALNVSFEWLLLGKKGGNR